MNPMQTITNRENAIKRQIFDASVSGVCGQPLEELKQQLINVRAEKRRIFEAITGEKAPLVSLKIANAKKFLVMGIPEFLLKH